MKLLAFIFEQPSYTSDFENNTVLWPAIAWCSYICIVHLGLKITFCLPKEYYAYITSRSNMLTLCLLVTSADNLLKQFGPRWGQQNVGPDLIQTDWYSDGISKRHFEGTNIWKKIRGRQISMKNYPASEEVMMWSVQGWGIPDLYTLFRALFSLILY